LLSKSFRWWLLHRCYICFE